MAKKMARRARSLDTDVIAFMSEFARYLIDGGMTTGQFAELAKVGFFEAASAGAKFSNSRVNQSAVAALTGMGRAEVREMAKRVKASPVIRPSGLEALVEGWSKDVRFIGSDYTPRRLAVKGRGAAFAQLVRDYGGDVPPRSMLRALQRKGYVEVKSGYAVLQTSAIQARGRARLQQAVNALLALIRSPASVESLSPIRILTMEVSHPAASAKGRIVIQKRAERSLHALMNDISAAGTAASLESPPGVAYKGWVTRVRVAVVAEDSAQ